MKHKDMLRILSLLLLGLFLNGCAMAAGAAAGALIGTVANVVSTGVTKAVQWPDKPATADDVAVLNKQLNEIRQQQIESQRQLTDSQQTQIRRPADQSSSEVVTATAFCPSQDEERLVLMTAHKKATIIIMFGSLELTGIYSGKNNMNCDLVTIERRLSSDPHDKKADTTTYAICDGVISAIKEGLTALPPLTQDATSPTTTFHDDIGTIASPVTTSPTVTGGTEVETPKDFPQGGL